MAQGVHCPQVILRRGIASIGGLAIPGGGFGAILRNTKSALKQFGKLELGGVVTRVGFVAKIRDFARTDWARMRRLRAGKDGKNHQRQQGKQKAGSLADSRCGNHAMLHPSRAKGIHVQNCTIVIQFRVSSSKFLVQLLL